MVRFGLNRDQIDRLGLTVDRQPDHRLGQGPADPKHPDHDKPYVQDYIRAHWRRKVEANALARDPAAAAAMVEAAINRYVPRHWPAFHAARLAPHVAAARRAFATLIASESE